jgi:DNA polymerase III delta subunit
MKSTTVRGKARNGEIHNQYIIVGTERFFADHKIQELKEKLKVDESFDLDTFYASESSIDEIFQKLYLTPFSSLRRLVVVRNLEDMDYAALERFATLINASTSHNCLAMTFTIAKDNARHAKTAKKLSKLFTEAHHITYEKKTAKIRSYITQRSARAHINLSELMLQYLEDEFSNDITGLENELGKIENYFAEAQTMELTNVQDLAKGLSDFSKYQVVNAFLDGRRETLQYYEELLPYLKSNAEMVYALTRGLLHLAQRSRRQSNVVIEILTQMSEIDRKVKRGSHFGDLMLELLFLQYAPVFRKGALYG